MSRPRPMGVPVQFDRGAHICHLYRTREDLFEVTLPYLKEGLREKQLCLWMAAPPLGVDEARRASDELTRDRNGDALHAQIEVIDWSEWSSAGGASTANLLKRWLANLKLARAQGFEGLRFAGNMSQLSTEDWAGFMYYEAFLDSISKRSHAIVLCSYPQDRLTPSQLVEVVSRHRVVLMRENGEWTTIRNAPQKVAVDVTDSDFSYAEIGRLLGMEREHVKEIVASGRKITRTPEDLLTVGQTAKFLNVSVNTVRRWNESGIIQSYRIGPRKDRRFKQQDLDRALKEIGLLRHSSRNSRLQLRRN